MVEVGERSGDDDLTRSPDPAPGHQAQDLDVGLGALPTDGYERVLEAPATDRHVGAQLVAGLDPGPGTACLAGSDQAGRGSQLLRVDLVAVEQDRQVGSPLSLEGAFPGIARGLQERQAQGRGPAGQEDDERDDRRLQAAPPEVTEHLGYDRVHPATSSTRTRTTSAGLAVEACRTTSSATLPSTRLTTRPA